MARYEEPPFARGETYFNGSVIDISNLSDLGGLSYEGREYEVEDSQHGSGSVVRLRVVRNMNATAVTGGQTLLHDSTAGKWNCRVNGLSTALADPVLVADELQLSSGVPQYDLFYVVVDGPVKLNQPASVAAALTIGDRVVSKGDTGSVIKADFSGATSVLAGQIFNQIGTVIGGLAGSTTTAQASGTVLVDVDSLSIN